MLKHIFLQTAISTELHSFTINPLLAFMRVRFLELAINVVTLYT